MSQALVLVPEPQSGIITVLDRDHLHELVTHSNYKSGYEQILGPMEVFVREGVEVQDFAAPMFPHDQLENGKWKWSLLSIEKYMSPEELALRVKQERCHLAKVRQLIAFGVANPHLVLQSKRPIIALGSMWQGETAWLAPGLVVGDGGEVETDLFEAHSEWMISAFFLCVEPEDSVT